MFQLLITVNLKSGVGAGVAISQTIASFGTKELANEAWQRLVRYEADRQTNPYSRRIVEKLYSESK